MLANYVGIHILVRGKYKKPLEKWPQLTRVNYNWNTRILIFNFLYLGNFVYPPLKIYIEKFLPPFIMKYNVLATAGYLLTLIEVIKKMKTIIELIF